MKAVLCPDRRPGVRPIRAGFRTGAFTLIEVMLAMAMFFMAVFAILALVSNSLRNARALQQDRVDAGALAAFLTVSNRLDEGLYSGDFGDLFPEEQYDFEVIPITNGLVRVDMVVRPRRGPGGRVSTLSVLLYQGQNPPGTALPLPPPTPRR